MKICLVLLVALGCLAAYSEAAIASQAYRYASFTGSYSYDTRIPYNTWKVCTGMYCYYYGYIRTRYSGYYDCSYTIAPYCSSSRWMRTYMTRYYRSGSRYYIQIISHVITWYPHVTTSNDIFWMNAYDYAWVSIYRYSSCRTTYPGGWWWANYNGFKCFRIA